MGMWRVKWKRRGLRVGTGGSSGTAASSGAVAQPAAAVRSPLGLPHPRCLERVHEAWASRGTVGSPSRWDLSVTFAEPPGGQRGRVPAAAALGSGGRCWVCVRGELPVGITGGGHASERTEPRASCSAVTPEGGDSPRGDTNPAAVQCLGSGGREAGEGMSWGDAGTHCFAVQVRFLPSCPVLIIHSSLITRSSQHPEATGAGAVR